MPTWRSAPMTQVRVVLADAAARRPTPRAASGVHAGRAGHVGHLVVDACAQGQRPPRAAPRSAAHSSAMVIRSAVRGARRCVGTRYSSNRSATASVAQVVPGDVRPGRGPPRAVDLDQAGGRRRPARGAASAPRTRAPACPSSRCSGTCQVAWSTRKHRLQRDLPRRSPRGQPHLVERRRDRPVVGVVRACGGCGSGRSSRHDTIQAVTTPRGKYRRVIASLATEQALCTRSITWYTSLEQLGGRRELQLGADHAEDAVRLAAPPVTRCRPCSATSSSRQRSARHERRHHRAREQRVEQQELDRRPVVDARRARCAGTPGRHRSSAAASPTTAPRYRPGRALRPAGRSCRRVRCCGRARGSGRPRRATAWRRRCR